MFKIVLAFWSKQTKTSFSWTKLNSKKNKNSEKVTNRQNNKMH